MKKIIVATVKTVASPFYLVAHLVENHLLEIYRYKRTSIKEVGYGISNLWRDALSKDTVNYSVELRDYDLWIYVRKNGFSKDFLKLFGDEFPGKLTFLENIVRYECNHHKYERYTISKNSDDTYDLFYMRRDYNSFHVESNISLKNISKREVLKVLSKERGKKYD